MNQKLAQRTTLRSAEFALLDSEVPASTPVAA